MLSRNVQTAKLMPTRTPTILCAYLNKTQQVQIIRIANISHWFFERVVLPGQRLTFKAFPEAVLEIQTSAIASAVCLDRMRCDRLQVDATISQFSQAFLTYWKDRSLDLYWTGKQPSRLPFKKQRRQSVKGLQSLSCVRV